MVMKKGYHKNSNCDNIKKLMVTKPKNLQNPKTHIVRILKE